MQLNDTHKSYGWVSITLHWLVGAMVVFMIVVAYMAGKQPPRTEEKTALLLLHASVGWLLLVPLLIRLAWRIKQRFPERPKQPPLLEFLSSVVPASMLVLLVIQLFLGAMIGFSYGHGIEIFGLHLLPSPLEQDMDLRSFFARLHYYNGYLIVALAVLHIAGALKHLVLDRDKIFQRMLWPEKE